MTSVYTISFYREYDALDMGVMWIVDSRDKAFEAIIYNLNKDEIILDIETDLDITMVYTNFGQYQIEKIGINDYV